MTFVVAAAAPAAESLRWPLSALFFGFTACFVGLSVCLMVARWRPWCGCHVCYTYVTSGWAGDFDNVCDWVAHLLRESPTRTIHIHVLGNTVTANKDNVQHMLRDGFHNYPKGRPFSSILGDLLGHGIFNVDGDHWRFQRKLASLELGSVSVRSYAFRIVTDEIRDRLLPFLDDRAAAAGVDAVVVDLQDVFRRFSFDNICKISFGLDPGCLKLSLPISEFAAAFDTATRLSAARATTVSPMVWRVKRALNLGSERELRRAIGIVNLLADEVIRHRRKELELEVELSTAAGGSGGSSSSSSRQDLLTRFMASVNDDKYLRDIVISFLLAGRDTVSSTLTSLFYLLSRHPDVEAAMLREIDSVTATTPAGASEQNNRPQQLVGWDQLREMHYVHAALYETMRLYPPVQFDSKFAAADDVLPDGTYVRKGTRVSFHPYAMGRLPEAWGEDWMEFRPERWLSAEDGVFTPENPFKYPVFQAGPRSCLGKELAVMEAKTVAVAVLRNFKVEVARPEQPLKFVTSLTASLRDGLPASVRRRGAARRSPR